MNIQLGDSSRSFNQALSHFDRAFSQGLEDELALLFSEDARLMWPGVEDIVGRHAIRTALGEFFDQFTTLSFSPDRQVVELCGDKAFIIGRFIEDLVPKVGGTGQRVHGRIVQMWSRGENGDWQIALLLTGRFCRE